MNNEHNRLSINKNGLSINAIHMEIINQLVETMVETIPAKFVVVIDKSGQPVAGKGELEKIDLSVLSSLVAADISASVEIAKFTGEFEEYQLIIREGRHSNLLISEVGNHLAVLVLISRTIPIGWARKVVATLSQNLDKQLGDSIQISKQAVTEISDSNLSGLYNDALEQIWKE